jgi:hypothetical protein
VRKVNGGIVIHGASKQLIALARRVINGGEDPERFHKQIVKLALDDSSLAVYLDTASARGVIVYPVITVDQELALEDSRPHIPKGHPERKAR